LKNLQKNHAFFEKIPKFHFQKHQISRAENLPFSGVEKRGKKIKHGVRGLKNNKK
jgi:hypothetical protein